MINFNDYVNEKNLNTIKIGHTLQIIHTEY